MVAPAEPQPSPQLAPAPTVAPDPAASTATGARALAAAGPTLPDGVNFEQQGNATTMVVRRAWLAGDPAWDETVTASFAPVRFREMLRALRSSGTLGWATDANIEQAAQRTTVTTGGQAPVIRLVFGASLYLHVGLPPAVRAAVSIHTNRLQVVVATPELQMERGAEVPLTGAHLHAIVQAVSQQSGMVPEVTQQQLETVGQRGTVMGVAGTGAIALEIDDAALEAMFGKDQVDRFRDRRMTKAVTTGAGPSVALVGATRVTTHGLTPEEIARVQAWLETHFGGEGAGMQSSLLLDKSVLEMMERVEKHPKRDEIIAAIARRRADGGMPAAIDSWKLDTVLQRAFIEAEEAALGITNEFIPGGDPAHDMPVPARIDQLAGKVQSGERVPFYMQIDYPPVWLTDEQQAKYKFRDWVVDVQWVFEKQTGERTGKPPAHVRQQFRGDRELQEHAFRLEPGEAGAVWEVRALVRHTHFQPAYLTTLVEVKSEVARMQELKDESFAELGQTEIWSHDFSTSWFNEKFGDEEYDKGHRLVGAAPAGIERTPEQRAAQRAKERERYVQLVAYMKTRPGDHASAIRAAQWQIERLAEADKAIVGDEQLGRRSFEVRGTYLSRMAGVQDGSLDLYGTTWSYQVQDKDKGESFTRLRVAVQIRDLSRRFESETYTFRGDGVSYQEALETAFVKLCKAYPPGRMAVLAQDHDQTGQKPSGGLLGFELDCGTEWKDVKAKVFDPVVSKIVNIAATALMIFLPAAAPVVGVMLAAYNGVESIDQLVDAHEKGTLTGSKVVRNLAGIALDLLPMVGRATRLGGSRTGMWILEGVDHGATAALMTSEAVVATRQLQEQQLMSIAQRFEQLLALEKQTHASDPRLLALRAQIDAESQQVSKAAYEVLGGMIADQAISFLPARALHAANHHRLTRRMEQLAGEGAFEIDLHGPARYDQTRGVILGAPKRIDGATLKRIEAEREAHMAEMADEAALALGAKREHIEIEIGDDADVHVGKGHVVLVYRPGMSPAQALARWRMKATKERMAVYHAEHTHPTRAKPDLPTKPARPAEGAPTVESHVDHVPGSTFRGRRTADNDPRMTAAERQHAQQVHAAAVESLEPLLGAQPGVASVASREVAPDANQWQVEYAKATYVVGLSPTPADAPAEHITVRVQVGPLDGESVSRVIANPSQRGQSTAAGQDVSIRGRYVIQISDELDPGQVPRAVAHQVAVIFELRRLHESGDIGAYGGADALQAGSAARQLSPHDLGRLAELRVLTEQVQQGGAVADAARLEVAALVDHLGLHDDQPGSLLRFDLAKSHMDERTRTLVHAQRKPHAAGTREHAAHVAMRERAQQDKAAAREREQEAVIRNEMPSTLDEHGQRLTETQLADRAQAAADARMHKSLVTWLDLEDIHDAARQRDEIPLLPWTLHIGGGASMAGRHPDHLVVDDRGRWQADGNTHIAQTGNQLSSTRESGLGDPRDVVGARERLPRDAVSYWEDHVAAQGPVVNGRASFRLGKDGEMLVDITQGSKKLTFRVDRPPIVATGFVPESVPGGPRGKTPRALQEALVHNATLVTNDATLQLPSEVRAALDDALALLQTTRLVTNQDAVAFGRILANRNLDRLPEPPPSSPGSKPHPLALLKPAIKDARQYAQASAAWEDAVAKDDPQKPHLFYGDHANLGVEHAKRSHNWVVAGTGGTAVSAAELVLKNNPKARVTMIGAESPAGLLENDQFLELARRHADPETLALLKLESNGSDGRLRVRVGYISVAPQRVDGNATGTGLVDESDIPPADRARRVYDLGARTGRDNKGDHIPATGTAYVAALGRGDDYPPAIAELIEQSRLTGGTYRVMPLFEQRQYAGYRVTIRPAKNAPEISMDVTGAASRFLPTNALAHMKSNERDLLQIVKNAGDWDMPAESGNFAGGFVGSATQASRYARLRAKEKEQQP